MDQSRSRFPARRHGVRAARDATGRGDAGAGSHADGNAGGGTDSTGDLGGAGANSWDPFDSSGSVVPDRYSRSSEQAGWRSKRKTDVSGKADRHGSGRNSPDQNGSDTDDVNTGGSNPGGSNPGGSNPGGPDANDSNSGNPGPDTPHAKPTRSLKGRALGYLSRRDYSRVELSGKLKSYVEESDNLEALLDALEQDGWLSNARFAASLMHRRSARFGTSRIVGELKRHEVDGDLVAQINTELRETEAARAKAVWSKKFGELPQSPAERAKQARFLASRGFSHAVIGRLLRGFDDETEFPDADAVD
jgi:regulatory protein